MTIPVRVYHGRLNVSSIPMTKQMLERVAPSSLREGGNVDSSTMIMDFGSMEEEEVSFALLQIHNPNPVPVLVTDLISLEPGVEFAYLTQVRASDEGKVKSVGAAQIASRIGSAAADWEAFATADSLAALSIEPLQSGKCEGQRNGLCMGVLGNGHCVCKPT